MPLSHARGCKSGVPWLVSGGVQPTCALEGQERGGTMSLEGVRLAGSWRASWTRRCRPKARANSHEEQGVGTRHWGVEKWYPNENITPFHNKLVDCYIMYVSMTKIFPKMLLRSNRRKLSFLMVLYINGIGRYAMLLKI